MSFTDKIFLRRIDETRNWEPIVATVCFIYSNHARQIDKASIVSTQWPIRFRSTTFRALFGRGTQCLKINLPSTYVAIGVPMSRL